MNYKVECIYNEDIKVLHPATHDIVVNLKASSYFTKGTIYNVVDNCLECFPVPDDIELLFDGTQLRFEREGSNGQEVVYYGKGYRTVNDINRWFCRCGKSTRFKLV